jgi:hypothetical protein
MYTVVCGPFVDFRATAFNPRSDIFSLMSCDLFIQLPTQALHLDILSLMWLLL